MYPARRSAPGTKRSPTEEDRDHLLAANRAREEGKGRGREEAYALTAWRAIRSLITHRVFGAAYPLLLVKSTIYVFGAFVAISDKPLCKTLLHAYHPVRPLFGLLSLRSGTAREGQEWQRQSREGHDRMQGGRGSGFFAKRVGGGGRWPVIRGRWPPALER